MNPNRTSALAAILRGFVSAVALTLLLMAALAALAVWLRPSDGALTALNQVLKLLAIVLGAIMSVGRGGHRGFVTGMTVAMLYMIAGYACYVLLGGNAFSVTEMLGEVLIGAAVGAIAGAVLSNLPARGRRRVA